MSVETPIVEETAPITTKPVESTIAPEEVSAPPSEPAVQKPNAELPLATGEKPLAAEPAEGEALVEAIPATEGILGYKAPGLLKQFRFVKHFFWFNEEPSSQEALDAYVKSEKPEIAHHHAAWAKETGKGVMYYSKRAEDKATPSGMILLAEAGGVTKIGTTDFSFKVGSHTHKFEASSATERDSWVVALEKSITESKEMKKDITERESYKKTLEGYSSSPIIAGAASSTPIRNGTPKKSIDASTATATPTTEPAAEVEPVVAAEETKKSKDSEKLAKKERSQSRKRNSVFGLFGKKEEDKDLKKEEKKVEKEHIKEEKKLEAEHMKEEAKAEHDAAKAKEAAEAAAVAAVPTAAIAAAEKEEKHEDKTEEAVSPSEKKSKRTSVFGGFFGKNKLTSPSVEKSEKEAGLSSVAQDSTPAVAETAPKLDEPIETKPIDAAAVTASADATETSTPAPAVPATEEVKATEPVAPLETTTTPRTEKKSFLAGFINKKEKKEEPKLEKTHEETVKDTAPAATTEPIATDGTVDTPVKDTEALKEERPAREKRRTSLFGSLGTLKRKTEKSPEPSSVASEDIKTSEMKREKSPIPSKLGGLFRKPSRAANTELATEEAKSDATAVPKDVPTTDAEITKPTEATATAGTPASTTGIESTESKIVGDVVPDELHTTVHDAVTTTPAEVKATA